MRMTVLVESTARPSSDMEATCLVKPGLTQCRR